MALTLEQIVAETAQWPEDVVADLIDRILVARHGGESQEISNAWKEELRRRSDEIKSGSDKGIPGDEVMAKVRRMVGR